jgi:transcriptional regulator of acetoin/glycerol metabolism
MDFFSKVQNMGYEININKKIQEINKQAWQDFLSGKRATPYSLHMLEAWERCRTFGVNPLQKMVKCLLSPPELELLKSKKVLLLEISEPVLTTIRDFVTGEDFVIALSDENGWLLKILGDEGLQKDVRRGNWVAGADWSEKSAGNNIIGTAIFLDKPVMIMGYEHFCKCSHSHAGAGAPIHDSDGNIIGALAIACKFEKVHPHTLGMIVAAGKAIELQMETKKSLWSIDMANNYKSVIINTMTEGLISVDENYKITLVNENACSMLQMKHDDLLSANLTALLPEATVNRIRSKTLGSIYKELVFFNGHIYIKCICSSRPIIENNIFKGMVLVINEFARAERLANKLVNKDAFFTFSDITGKSESLKNALFIASNAATTESNVLLLGESGTGKDVFAQAIHNASSRRQGPYVAINCAAIPKDLINSELFGYSEGAFTGAKKGGNKGKVELADGGTLFLDEIGEMPLEHQTVLLRLLENRTIQKVGGYESSKVDIRVIAATNKNLLEEIKNKRFRQDLYYRLNVFTVRIPALRNRIEDISELADIFLKRLAERRNLCPLEIDGAAMNMLKAYSWPGNIRELQNILERVSMMAADNKITADLIRTVGELGDNARPYMDFPYTANAQSGSPETRNKLALNSEMLYEILNKNKWNITKTCLELGISRPTLYRKIEEFGISINRGRNT